LTLWIWCCGNGASDPFVIARAERLVAGPPSSRQRLIHGNPCQPRGEPGPSLELTEVTIGIDVGLLNGVLGVRVVLENGTDGAVETLVVAAHEDLEEMNVPSSDSNHDFLVCQRTGLKKGNRRDRIAC
jgi:hypothetical protein